MEEIEVWIARDRDNFLWMYSDKPNKYSNYWDAEGPATVLKTKYFPNIKWEDKEPTRAKIILNK